MAVTKIIPIHFTIDKSVKYICNPNKTGDCLYIHSEHCVPETAAFTFQHHWQQAQAGGKIIGRHLIQSFTPGEVEPETAHEIGKRLAEEILGGKYAFVMATHIDRGHIHNHFVWGAADVQTHKRYHSSKRSYREIRNVSDHLCEQFDLSVIIPHGVGKHYAEYQAEKTGASWKVKLKEAIDVVLSESVDFDNFLRRMELHGYEIKKGTHISFCAPGQARFTRGKTLGTEYTEEALKRRVVEKAQPNSVRETASTKVKNVIDIAGNEKISSSPAYRQWAAVFNLKQSVAAFNQIQQYGGLDAFDKLCHEAIGEKMEIAQKLNGLEAEIKIQTNLRNMLRAYGRTKEVYRQFREQPSQRKKEKFYNSNQSEIDTHKAAKKALSKMEKPVPSVKTVSAEIERLKSSKASLSEQYKQHTVKMKEMETTQKNIYNLLRQQPQHKQKRDTDLSR